MWWLDRLAAGLLAPLAMWVLASGLDDLFLDLASIYFRLKQRLRPRQASPRVWRPSPVEKRIALLIPAWREDAVIERMLEHNLAAIRYSDYEVFVGVYPNDLRTVSRVAACGRKWPRVHYVVCPHDGPTSKADCLNWVYQGVLLWEEEQACRFDILLHHDAEDLIHPQSFQWINGYTDHYDMVQVPVLPLPTPWWELTHGVYCDEFAQSHLKDLQVRQWMNGFVPSCGVGTAYRRRAADRLAWNQGGLLFRPDSLTEDYQMGLDLHRLGCSQILLDARRLGDGHNPGATREYFPRRPRSAVRQKGRWVAGIALQSWEDIGWNAGPGQLYWLWRDRKGLVGNPLTILANLLFLYGLFGWTRSSVAGDSWELGDWIGGSPWLLWLLALNAALFAARQASRASCVQPIYGWKHALISPLRSVWGNWINFAATLRALALFAGARIRRQAPRWLKTDHSYPSGQALRVHKRRLGELLAEMQMLPASQIEQSLALLQPGERLGEALVRAGALSEPDLYRALGAQQSLVFEPLEAARLEPDALARLPRQVARSLQVVPVRIAHERYLWVAGPELPRDAVAETIGRMTELSPRFQLITPSNYRTLCEQLDRAQG